MNDDVADTFSVEDDNIPSLSPVSGSVKEDVGVRPPSLFLRNEFCECAAARRRDQAEAFPRRSTVGEIWDEGDSFGAGEADDWHDSNLTSDVEGSSTFELLPEPRKVQKVFVKYDRTSKQADVHRLKEYMWEPCAEGSSCRRQSSRATSQQPQQWQLGESHYTAFLYVSVLGLPLALMPRKEIIGNGISAGREP